MSAKTRNRSAETLRRKAPLFAALGDETRLALLMKLGGAPPLSIKRLTEGTTLTRQAVTKHLRVLEEAGFVRGMRQGRENVFTFEPESLNETRDVLEFISQQWDEALDRLKTFVEK